MSESGYEAQCYLPEVNEDVGGAFVRNIFEDSGKLFYKGVQEKFNREQRYLSDVIGDAMEEIAESADEYNRMGLIVLFMYELLSGQAEANAMRQHFNVSGEDVRPDNE